VPIPVRAGQWRPLSASLDKCLTSLDHTDHTPRHFAFGLTRLLGLPNTFFYFFEIGKTAMRIPQEKNFFTSKEKV
jgi:hypothetical protein